MKRDRQRGALIGLAVGDALGAAVEFMPPGTFPPVTGYRRGGPHKLEPGEWTDDTSMALALGDSIALGFDLVDQTERYLRWWQHGAYSVTGSCFDIGTTVRRALESYLTGRDAACAADPSESASGNGSIMRLAPIAIRYGELLDHDLEKLAWLGAQSSVPTHRSPQCLSACRYLSVVLSALMNGAHRDEVLSPAWPVLHRLQQLEPLHPLIGGIAAGSFRHTNPPEIRGSGWVVQSLEAALWAFHDAESFDDAVLRAVNLGEDADTTGAICGQLAGAYWGESQIPERFRTGLARMDMIEEVLEKLFTAPSITEGDRV